MNKHRAGKGLPPLVMNEAIAAEAQKHSRNMASGKVPFGHDGFEGRSDRLLNGIKGANASAENVASSPYDAERVVKMWLESPRHLKNIEGSYNLTGIGIAKGTDGNLLYTQLFINSK
ncbi:MAG: CAP domain-containing protein [Taibaiella sp.]|nr:CAP domain-containing protein [Taibaiella sp.]